MDGVDAHSASALKRHRARARVRGEVYAREHQARGLCSKCCAPAAPGRKGCERHLQAYREYLKPPARDFRTRRLAQIAVQVAAMQQYSVHRRMWRLIRSAKRLPQGWPTLPENYPAIRGVVDALDEDWRTVVTLRGMHAASWRSVIPI